MKTISGKIIDRTWKRINEAAEEEAQRLLDVMAKQQPFVVAYLLAVEETLMAEEERGRLMLIGLILWQIIYGENSELRQINMDDLEAAEFDYPVSVRRLVSHRCARDVRPGLEPRFPEKLKSKHIPSLPSAN